MAHSAVVTPGVAQCCFPTQKCIVFSEGPLFDHGCRTMYVTGRRPGNWLMKGFVTCARAETTSKSNASLTQWSALLARGRQLDSSNPTILRLDLFWNEFLGKLSCYLIEK